MLFQGDKKSSSPTDLAYPLDGSAVLRASSVISHHDLWDRGQTSSPFCSALCFGIYFAQLRAWFFGSDGSERCSLPSHPRK
jgi:hypothetical protein